MPSMLRVNTPTRTYFFVDRKRVPSEVYHLINYQNPRHDTFVTKVVSPDRIRHYHEASKDKPCSSQTTSTRK